MAIDTLVMTAQQEGALWFFFALFALTSIWIFAAALLTRGPDNRLHHYLSFTICVVAALCYLLMALDMGAYKIHGNIVFFPRFADWLITTPLLLITLGMCAGLNASNIFALCVLDTAMICSGIFATVATGGGAWGLFAFGICCFVPIFYFLLEDFDMERAIEHTGEKAASRYRFLSYYLVGFWTFYPVVWILVKTHVLSVTGEVVLYGILDVLSKAVFAAGILSTLPSDEEAADIEKEAETTRDKRSTRSHGRETKTPGV